MMIKNKKVLERNPSMPELRIARKTGLEALKFALGRIDLEERFEDFIHSGSLSRIVVAIGKASVKMFKSYKNLARTEEGVIISPWKVRPFEKDVKIFVAGHPYPDSESIKAARYVIAKLKTLNYNENVVFLISGGGSSLFELPRIPLQDLIAATRILLSSGATIEEINTVRKHLSKVKGGQLLRYLKGHGISLLMSDVQEDRVDLIASGLTAPDSTTYEDAFRILHKYEIWEPMPPSVKRTIKRGMDGTIPETLKRGEPLNGIIENHVILTNGDLLRDLESFMKMRGFETISLGSDNHMDIDLLVDKFLSCIKQMSSQQSTNVSVLAGGEASVRVTGAGKGGRNQELALRMAVALKDTPLKFIFISFGTDGIDGPTDAAGAIVDNETLPRASSLSLSPEKFILENNSYDFFSKLNDLIKTGPTGINVKDIYLLLIVGKGSE